MRLRGRFVLEVLFVALLYTTVSVLVRVTYAGQGGAMVFIKSWLVNCVVIVPVLYFLVRVRGTWWSVGGAATVALALLHHVAPRMERFLERGMSLQQVPWIAIQATLAALVAVLAMLLITLRSTGGWELRPPPLRAAGPAVSYVWRLPAFVAIYATLHLLVGRLGRAVLGHSTRVHLADELLVKVAVGLVVAVALVPLAAHLIVRSRSRVATLMAVAVLLPLVGRWLIVAAWPIGMASLRLSLRAVADAGAVGAAAWLLLARKPSGRRHRKAESGEAESKPGEPAGQAALGGSKA